VFGWNKGGIFSVANHFQRIFGSDCDLVKFGSLKNEKTVNVLSYSDVSDFSSYDATFFPNIRGFTSLKESMNLDKCPRPIVARVDDVQDTDFKNWGKDVDVFWCFKNKMYEYVRQNTNKKVVLSGLPYFPFSSSQVIANPRTILSVCRLDPIKRIETLIDVAGRVNGRIVLLLYMMDFLKNYNRTIEGIAKERKNIECFARYYPFEESEVFEALALANSYYSATVWSSGTGVEYAALEAMNSLCVPVIRNNMESDYRREGYRACFWEYHEDLVKEMERSFVDQSMLNDNVEKLQFNCDNFKSMFEEIVNDWHHH
jgi:glycosyltransferase involved in cell wall biosynthesis